ncbi:MAG: arginine repressor [Ruminococcus sp.]|nr:arginine repressor [Ruminococcus sp.]
MKSDRHELILKLISREVISTQEELKSALAKEGMNVTQATLSRDMRELALTKATDSEGRYRYTEPAISRSVSSDSAALYSLLADAVVAVDYAMNTVVVKCMTGMAQAVCAKLDNIRLDKVVGTLAGDDTIFILMRTEHDAKQITAEFRAIITN